MIDLCDSLSKWLWWVVVVNQHFNSRTAISFNTNQTFNC